MRYFTPMVSPAAGASRHARLRLRLFVLWHCGQKLETQVGIVAFLVMVGYYPRVLGAGTVGRWAILFLALPLLSMRETFSGRWSNSKSAIIAFSIFASASLIWMPFPLDGIQEAITLGTLLLAGLIGRSVPSLKSVFLGATGGIAVNSLVALWQFLDNSGWQTTGALTQRSYPVIQICCKPSGLFLNGNIMAETAALVIVGVIVTGNMTRWNMGALIALVLPALLLPMQRGSMIALAIVAMIWLSSIVSRKFCLMLWCGMLGLASITVIGFVTFDRASPFIALSSLNERLAIWSATLSGLTPFGHGIGSFRGLFPLYAGDIDTMVLWPQFAHNDILQLAFEFGLFAAIPVIAILILLAGARSPIRYVVIAFVLEGLFEFPLHMPATGFLAAISIGHLCRDWSRHRVIELCRGMVSVPRLRAASA